LRLRAESVPLEEILRLIDMVRELRSPGDLNKRTFTCAKDRQASDFSIVTGVAISA
jgi:hypothetical protein